MRNLHIFFKKFVNFLLVVLIVAQLFLELPLPVKDHLSTLTATLAIFCTTENCLCQLPGFYQVGAIATATVFLCLVTAVKEVVREILSNGLGDTTLPELAFSGSSFNGLLQSFLEKMHSFALSPRSLMGQLPSPATSMFFTKCTGNGFLESMRNVSQTMPSVPLPWTPSLNETVSYVAAGLSKRIPLENTTIPGVTSSLKTALYQSGQSLTSAANLTLLNKITVTDITSSLKTTLYQSGQNLTSAASLTLFNNITATNITSSLQTALAQSVQTISSAPKFSSLYNFVGMPSFLKTTSSLPFKGLISALAEQGSDLLYSLLTEAISRTSLQAVFGFFCLMYFLFLNMHPRGQRDFRHFLLCVGSLFMSEHCVHLSIWDMIKQLECLPYWTKALLFEPISDFGAEGVYHLYGPENESWYQFAFRRLKALPYDAAWEFVRLTLRLVNRLSNLLTARLRKATDCIWFKACWITFFVVNQVLSMTSWPAHFLTERLLCPLAAGGRKLTASFTAASSTLTKSLWYAIFWTTCFTTERILCPLLDLWRSLKGCRLTVPSLECMSLPLAGLGEYHGISYAIMCFKLCFLIFIAFLADHILSPAYRALSLLTSAPRALCRWLGSRLLPQPGSENRKIFDDVVDLQISIFCFVPFIVFISVYEVVALRFMFQLLGKAFTVSLFARLV